MRLQFSPWPCSVGRGSGVAMSCGVGCRRCLDPTLLWLWCRLVATAPIRPLAWEPPYATAAALQKAKRKKKKQKKLRIGRICLTCYSAPTKYTTNIINGGIFKGFPLNQEHYVYAFYFPLIQFYNGDSNHFFKKK